MNKKITIGITGHRDIIITNQLKKDIKNFFINFYEKDTTITLLSPLADGADRLVAKIFLELKQQNKNVNYELIVPMPFSKKRYMEDFTKISKIDFLQYLKFTDKIIEVENNHGCNYKSVGIYVADQSDILLALWDGSFNKKSGGTGDIVEYSKNNNKKVVHFLCQREKVQ
jgi:hypothetical protein